MTALEQARKEQQCCKRCGVELTEHDATSLCTPHQLDLNRRVRESKLRARAARRTGEVPTHIRRIAARQRMLPVSTAVA